MLQWQVIWLIKHGLTNNFNVFYNNDKCFQLELMIAIVRAIIILALGVINPDVYSTDTDVYERIYCLTIVFNTYLC